MARRTCADVSERAMKMRPRLPFAKPPLQGLPLVQTIEALRSISQCVGINEDLVSRDGQDWNERAQYVRGGLQLKDTASFASLKLDARRWLTD